MLSVVNLPLVYPFKRKWYVYLLSWSQKGFCATTPAIENLQEHFEYDSNIFTSKTALICHKLRFAFSVENAIGNNSNILLNLADMTTIIGQNNSASLVNTNSNY